VDISEKKPKVAVLVFEEIVRRINFEGARKLLLQVNHHAMTPLDLATDKQLPEMVWHLLNTVGVYKFPLRECGLYAHILYDLTGCEGILRGISLITEGELKRYDEFNFLDREPIKSWMNEKFRAVHTAVMQWTVVWIVFLFAYISFVLALDAETGFAVNAFHICVITFGVFLSAEELIGVYASRGYVKLLLKRLRAGKVPVTFVWGYKAVQISFSTLIIIHHAVALTELHCKGEIHQEMYVAVRINMMICGFMGVMFFTQLNKRVGHYLTVIEKMMKVSMSFLLIGLLLRGV
jgi:hypothetical protein